jgi:hypothetical protein
VKETKRTRRGARSLDLPSGTVVLRPGKLPDRDRRRIEAIIRWEDESAAADFVIACPPVVRVGSD